MSAVVCAADTPKVVVTIKPLHSLVAAVMEGVAEPTLLIEGVQSPHNFALKPSQAGALNDADIIFLADRHLEQPIERISKSLPDSVLVVELIRAPGVQTYGVRSADGDGIDHDHAHEDGHGASDGHDHGLTDPHFWLDPKNARAAVKAVAARLAKQFPNSASRFEANEAEIDARLQSLDTALGQQLAAVRDRPFLVFHDAFQYFERRFRLKAAGAITINPEALPGARRISQLRRRIAEHGVVCVMSEPQFQARVIDTIIEGQPVRQGVADPLGSKLEAGPGQYEAMMRQLAAAFVDCLAGSKSTP